jgi:subtilisin family serine protease
MSNISLSRYIIIFVLVLMYVAYTIIVNLNEFKLGNGYAQKWVLDSINGSNFSTKIDKKDINMVKVAIIDTGIDEKNSNLKVVSLNLDESKNDSTYHGTAVAGLIASKRNNTIDFEGMIPGLTIYGYEIPYQKLNSKNLANAIHEVIKWDVDVINISLGTFKEDIYLFNSIKAAVDMGIVVVASSGNSASSSFNYPASYKINGVISVGALDRSLNILRDSNVNDSVDVFAPGVDIDSLGKTIENKGTKTKYSGTSIATPIVTVLVTLMKAKCPETTPDEIEDIIVKSSHYYQGYWGVVNRMINIINVEDTLKNTHC